MGTWWGMLLSFCIAHERSEALRSVHQPNIVHRATEHYGHICHLLHLSAAMLQHPKLVPECYDFVSEINNNELCYCSFTILITTRQG